MCISIDATFHLSFILSFLLGGALAPLINMARSGDRHLELQSVKALSNLALSDENQKQILKEGGVKALHYLTNSSNEIVNTGAKKLVTRMRLAKLRVAARFAGKLALQAKRSI